MCVGGVVACVGCVWVCGADLLHVALKITTCLQHRTNFSEIYFGSPDLKNLIVGLSRQFDVDPLLQRSVIWIHLRIAHIQKLPALYRIHRNLLESSLNAEALVQGFHWIVQILSKTTPQVLEETKHKVGLLMPILIIKRYFLP